MANVFIDIAAEFTGKKAFKQADSATDRLIKSTKKLAGAFGLAYGTAQVIAYGKASVKAAAADQKAQQQLALALKNVGLGRDAASTEGYIQRLQSEFGIVDDLLRPSYQTLAIATRDSAEAQRLMGIAMDVSAATGKDLGSVTAALSKAYLGNNTALTRLGVGISKADLKTKSFKEITDQLSTTFAGSATTAASGYQGSLDRLTVATNNFKESIGVGLLEALNILNGEQGLAKTTSEIDKLGIKLQNATIGAAYFVDELKKIPGGSFLTSLFGKTFGDPLGLKTLINEFEKFKQQPRPFSTGMSISGQVQIKQQAQITKLTKEQAAAQSKITKDKKLQAALDKANLALNKGSEVFDMDKIQIAAALTSQAEQLGKATNGAQLLQIANDTARLNVKKSILDLEDAIASKDAAAIEAATAKLNADLKVLGALGMQNVKLQDIKSILDTLQPKDLINLQNLKDAIALLAQIKIPSMAATIAPSGSSVARALESFKGSAASAFESLTPAQQATLGGYTPFVGADISNVPPSTFGGSGAGLGTNGTGRQIPVQAGVSITVNTGIGDPNAIAEAIENVITEAVSRGTLRGLQIA